MKTTKSVQLSALGAMTGCPFLIFDQPVTQLGSFLTFTLATICALLTISGVIFWFVESLSGESQSHVNKHD